LPARRTTDGGIDSKTYEIGGKIAVTGVKIGAIAGKTFATRVTMAAGAIGSRIAWIGARIGVTAVRTFAIGARIDAIDVANDVLLW
jgi:hypothetical protein